MVPPAGSLVLSSSSEEQLPNLVKTAVVDVCVDLEILSVLLHDLRGSVAGLMITFSICCGMERLECLEISGFYQWALRF